MKPIKFEGVNVTFGANQPEYLPLPAQRLPGDCGQIVTCWELSPEEIKQVQRTGKIYLSVLTFNNPLQPVLLTTEKPGRYKEENEQELR